jgi:hypothetical protein
VKPLPPLKIVGGDERYEIEEVINSHLNRGKLQYLVRWRGYSHTENSWIAEGNLDALDLIAKYYRANANAPKHISTVDFGRLGF